VAAVGRLWTSTWSSLSWSTATAHLRLPPYTGGVAVGAAEVDGAGAGSTAAKNVSAGMIWPFLSVTVMFPCLYVAYVFMQSREYVKVLMYIVGVKRIHK
jgi:hypothetical protein